MDRLIPIVLALALAFGYIAEKHGESAYMAQYHFSSFRLDEVELNATP